MVPQEVMEAGPAVGRVAGRVEVRPGAVPVALLVDRLDQVGLHLRRGHQYRRCLHRQGPAIRTRAVARLIESKIRLTEAQQVSVRV